MTILIVCIQGLTSGVLATKLNKIAKERDDDYHFKSINYLTVEEEMVSADIIFLTPQVKRQIKNFDNPTFQSNDKIYVLPDISISFDKIDQTYDNIISYIKNSEQDQQKSYQELILNYVSELLIFILLVLGIGAVGYALYKISDSLFLYEIYQKSIQLLPLFVVLFNANIFSKIVDEKPLLYYVIALIVFLTFLPIEGGNTTYDVVSLSPQSYLSLGNLKPIGTLFYLPLSFLVFYLNHFLAEKICQFYVIKLRQLKHPHDLPISLISLIFVFLFCLSLRSLLIFLF